MTLYEMKEQWQEVFAMLENPDVPDDAIFDTIEMIECGMEEKAEAYGKMIRNLESANESMDGEVNRLQSRMKSNNNRVASMKERLFDTMKATGQSRIQTPLFTFTVSKNGGVLPVNIVSEVPSCFLKPGEPDMGAIRKALQNGEHLEFAELGERGESLRMR